MNAVLKGESYTSGTVHRAREIKHPDKSITKTVLVQECGISRGQLAYLIPVPADTVITCRRCAALS